MSKSGWTPGDKKTTEEQLEEGVPKINAEEIDTEELDTRIGTLDAFADARKLFTEGYVGKRDRDIKTQTMNTYGNITTPTDIRVQGNYAYVCDGGGTITVLDISDPFYIKEETTITVGEGDTLGGMALYKGYLFVVNESARRLHAVSVHDLTSLSVSGTLDDTAFSTFEDIVGKDDVLYVCASGDVTDGEMIVVDISDPTSMTVLDRVSNADRVEIQGDVAYTVTVDSTEPTQVYTKFTAWDISENDDIVKLDEAEGQYYYDLSIQGERAYLTKLKTGMDTYHIDVFDISDSTNLSLLNSSGLAFGFRSMYITTVGDFIYGYGDGDLEVFEIQADDSVINISELTTANTNENSIRTDGERIYLVGDDVTVHGQSVRKNKGTKTGAVLIDSTGAVTVTVSHGLDFTPNPEDINAFMTNPSQTDWYGYVSWIDNIDPTSFDVHIYIVSASGTGSATAGLSWSAEV